MDPHPLKRLPTPLITPELFRPFGQLITATGDGKPFDAEDAQLVLHPGIPRFYIMRLEHKGRTFSRITRHHHCTQCLGSLEGKEWFIAVAPATVANVPDPDKIMGFRIPGNCFIKLHVGTWHSGPFFDAPAVDFYNLELSETNLVDHDTCDLEKVFGVEYELEAQY